ncbi:MAG: gliding motility-associated C-terminal domain-containing protein [Saprospiraceae bacterium]
MHRLLRFSLVFITLFSFIRLASAQTVDTIFGCDEIPNSPLAGAACTICNFDILYGTTFPFTPSPDAGWCGSIENDQYIGFVAGPTGSVVFEMSTFGCVSGQGVQVGIYDADNSLVGDCFNQVMPGTPQIFTAGGLTPGTVYYMRIDGFAGDGCEFNIQVISGLISTGPDAPGPIMGPTEVCWDEAYDYVIAPVANATSYYWRVTPGVWTLGTTVDPPEATNVLTGTTDLGIEVQIPPMSLGMPPGTCDNILLEVFPLNPCFASSDSSVFNIQVCRPSQDTTYADVCIGGEYEFPLGSGNFFSTPYVFETVDVGPAANGCDTFGVLYLEQVPGAINPVIENVVLCEGDVANICGFPDPLIVSGPAFCAFPGAAANGCDSLVYYWVQFLDPEAHIEAATGAISCTNVTDTLWAVTRTGSIPPSTAGDTISYVWTDASSGILGTNEYVVVTEPGTYTLTVNMTSDLDPTVVCPATTDITILDARTAPNPPALNGLTPVCSNDVPQDYTASGAMGTDQYLWSVTPASGLTYSVGTDILTITDFGTLANATVCVSTYNSCDTSTATCLPIVILPLPTPATLPALDTLCEGDNATYPIGGYDSNLTYTISSNPSGSSASVSGSNIDFTMGNASGQLCLEVSNQCETLTPVCMDIELRLPPVAIAPTGPTDVCIGQVEDYTLYTSLPFGTTASVTVTGGTIQSQSGNVATIEWTTAGAGEVCVTYTNVCGDDQACLAVTVNTAGTAVMSGGGAYCEGNNDVVITIDFTGVGPYDYSYLHNATVVTGSSASTPVTITAPAVGTYELTTFSVGACAGTVSGTAMVEENPTPEATISGGGNVCPGEDATITIDFVGVAPWNYEIALNSTWQGVQATSDNPTTILVSDPGTYTLVSVESDAGCIGTVSGTAIVDTLGSPVAGPTAYVCSPDGTTYTIAFPISGGDAGTYMVSPAGSGTITGSVFTSNAILSGDPYTFTVTDGNDCDDSVVSGMETCPCVTEIGTLDNTAVDICDDGTATDFSTAYDATNEILDPNDTRVYILHTGAGTTITGAIATNTTGLFAFDPGTMTYGTTYYISVVVGNDDGSGEVDLTHICTLVAPGVAATWYVIPDAVLVGGGDVCQGADSTAIVNFTGVGPFTISYTVGANSFTETTTDNPYTINLTNLQADVTVTLNSVATANCPGTSAGSASFVVHEEVQIVADAVCNSTSTEFVVTITISGGDPSTYSVVPNTGTLVGNVFTSNPITAGSGYSFTVSDQWGCNTAVASEPVVICNCISDAGTMDQTQITVCGPVDITVVMPLDTMMDSDDAINFVLHDGTGNTIGANLITQQAGLTFAFVPGVTMYGVTYYISSIMGNGPGGVVDLNDPCLDVAVGTPVQWLQEPSATLSGGGDYCIGDQIDLVFDVTSAGPVVVEYSDGTTTYTANLASGSTTVPAPLGTSATYTITSITEGPCTGTVSGSAVVVVHDAPVVGTPTITFNSTFTEYQVMFTISLGDTATYTVDGTAVGGGTTYTSAWIACGLDYTFVIDDQYGCSPVTISSPVNCDCRTAVGTLAGDLATCDLTDTTAPVYDATNQDLDGDDAVEYILYLVDFNTPIQRGSTPNFSFDPGSMTTGTIYYIVAVAGNSTAGTVDLSDPCLSVSPPVTAAWYDQPTVTATAPSAICANEDWIVTINVTGTPDPKTVYYTFNSVQDSLLGVVPGTASLLTFSGVSTSSITITGVADDDCGGTANITLNVTVASELFVNSIDDDNCDATNTEYFVTFEITGGDASTYQVTPAGSGTITGSTFTSNIIASGTPYSFEVSDGSGCFTVPVTGNRRCDCNTDAGQMTSTAMLLVCEGEDLAAGFSIGSETLDGNDQLLFALRTSGDRLDYTDDLVALSPTPLFPFDAGIMQAGDTFYISPIAGDAMGATIDTNDPCLSIGLATPIYIEYIPSGQLEGDTIICEGGTAQITLVLAGNGPFDVTIAGGDTGSDTTLTGVNNGFIYQVDPATGLIYVMNNITMNALPQCASNPNARVNIDVDALLTAGDEMAALVLCEGTGDVIQLSDQITGEDTGGSWTQVNGSAAGSDFNVAAGVVTNNSLAPGAYSFTYTVGSGAPCPQDAADVAVEIEAGPNADAGPDQAISCDQPVVNLGASSIPGYTYRWVGTVADSTSSQTTTENAGTFTLFVASGTQGCEGQDEVIVESAGDLPTFENMLLRDVTCFGDTDGAIFTGVDGGTGPYNYTLDGGPTRLSGQFTNLTPGIHELTVEDNEGCIYTELFTIEDAKEVVVDPGPNLEIPFGSSQLIELYLEGAIESVRWQGDSLQCLSPGPICDRVMLYPQYSGVYRVTARDSNGCTASAPLQLIVRRDRPVGVASGFSPNGDGNNDLIFVQAQEGVLEEVSSFQIFDRWGEQVFAAPAHQPNSPGYGWNGFLNGEAMNPQVFVYFAEIVYTDGTTDVIKGDITLTK